MNDNNNNNKYRANRKKFFLTYPRCDKSPEQLYEHLNKISSIHKYLIAKELHKDGAYHLHAYIEFVEKQDFKNPRWADFDKHHPNDAGNIRNSLSVEKYCTKDGNYISNFYKLDPWLLALNPETSYEDAILRIKEERPKDYILYRHNIVTNLRNEKRRKIELKKPEIELRDWQKDVLCLLLEDPKPRTIIWIWSERSEMGKTTFKKYIEYYFKDSFLLGTDKLSDTMYMYTDQRIIWFDVPRQHPLDADFTSQLEKLSDGGTIASSKYTSTNKIVDAHIVVTTNRPPPHEKLPNRISEFMAYI